MTRLYPRSTMKRIIKAHRPKAILSKKTDSLIYLDFLLFIQELAKESQIETQFDGDKNIQARHVKRVTGRILRRFKG